MLASTAGCCPCLSLSTWEPGTFGPRCVGAGLVDPQGRWHERVSHAGPWPGAQGTRSGPAAGSTLLGRPVLLGLGGVLGSALLSCPTSARLYSGVPCGVTAVRLSCERGATPGAQGCPREVSFLGLRGVLARTGSPSGLAQSSPFPLPGQRGCGAAGSVACGAISQQQAGSLHSNA